jgi:hypothetical protein
MARQKGIKLERKTKEVKLGQSVIIPIREYSLMAGNKIAYNPDTISLETYNEMRKFPTIAGALDVIKLPIISVDWYIESSDERKKKFVDKVLRDIWAGFIRDLLTAYDFGFSAFEKVFDMNEDTKIIIKKLFSLSPFYTKIRRTDDVSFDGIYFQPQGASGASGITLSADKSFIFTYKKEFENMYGAPRIRGAYTAWYIARYILEFTNIFYERYSSPQLVGYAPTAKIDYQGKKTEATKYLLDVMKSMQNASSVVLPHTGGKKDELKYHIDILESARTGGDFINYLKYLDNQMFTGSGIPPLAYSAGEKGSYSLFETQQALFAQGVDGDLTVIKQHIDTYIIKPLIKYNFPDSASDDTRWVYQSLANRDKELTRQIMIALVQQGKVDVAVKYLSEALGMPMIETGKIIEEAKQAASPTEGKATGQANQTKLSRNPNVKRYDDKINYERIDKQYDDNEQMIIGSLMPVLTKQKIKLLDSIQKSIKNPTQISGMELSFKSEYETKVVESAKKIFNDGEMDVKSENKVRVTLPKEAGSWVVASSKNIADKHMNDLKFSVISATLLAISKEMSEKEILFKASEAFDKYTDVSLSDSASLISQKYYSEGREYVAVEAGIKYAQWSAVLDGKECEFCNGRDGMIVEVASPDFSEYSPGNVHENCRCMWIYLDTENFPEGATEWRSPSKRDVKQYYQ